MRNLAVGALLVVSLHCGSTRPQPPSARTVSLAPSAGSSSSALPSSLPSSSPAVAAGPRDVPESAWPVDPAAQWPKGCLIHWASVHPTRPWVALACSTDEADYDEITGAVIVVDASTGRLRSTTMLDAGASAFYDRLRWHPDGKRIAANFGTNQIAILERGEVRATGSPDDGRDHGLDFAFVGDRLFIDMGGYFVPGESGAFERLEPATAFFRLEYNPLAKLVVGFNRDVLLGYAPYERARKFRLETGGHHPRCAPDGLRCSVVVNAEDRPKGKRLPAQRLRVFDGTTGERITDIVPSLPQIDRIVWSKGRRAAFTSHRYHRRRRRVAEHIDIVQGDRLVTTVDVGRERVRGGYLVDEGNVLAWSSNGRLVWALLDAKHIVAYAADTGRVEGRFPADPPPLPPWMVASDRHPSARATDKTSGVILAAGEDRVLRVAKHFVSVWSLGGDKLAEWTAER